MRDMYQLLGRYKVFKRYRSAEAVNTAHTQHNAGLRKQVSPLNVLKMRQKQR